MKPAPEHNDPFLTRAFSPMLFHETEPFDSDDYIFELKMDGIRALAYLDNNQTVLINKRGKDVTQNYPELATMHRQSQKRAVIDGELVVFTKGKPDFFRLQRRSLLVDKLKIKLSSAGYPVTFVTFDLLYCDHETVTDKPLLERKKRLNQIIKENNQIVVSRYIETKGIDFFNLAKKENLEGVVAKEKNSRYYSGKRCDVWLKIKVYQEEDLVICGYIPKESGSIKDLILGEYDQNGRLSEKVKINTTKNQKVILDFAATFPAEPLFLTSDDNAVWMKPYLVGTVSYMMKTTSGGLRQPVFKGVSTDKVASDLLKS